MRRIETLPAELKFEILKWFDIEDLLKIDLPTVTIRRIFKLSITENAKSWFANYVLRKDRGYLYIPENSKLMINNDIGSIPAIVYHYDKIDKPTQINNNTKIYTTYPEALVEVAELNTMLEPGFYRLRVLLAGFDLCKANGLFISQQCGPKTCFPLERDQNWPASYLSRGFQLQIENRKDLAPATWNNNFPSLYSMGKCFDYIKGPVLIIKVSDSPYKHTRIDRVKNFNVDDLARKKKKHHRIELYVMRAVENLEILAYIIKASNFFASYDPSGNFLLDKGRRDFCISKYKYIGTEQFVGLIICGLNDGYGLPAALNEIGLSFPDEKQFENIKFGV